MKIGITERGDAGIDMSWAKKIDTIDGAILITKNITNEFIYRVLRCKKPLIVHCTCTGYGGTVLEPNVPKPEKQIEQCMQLIDKGFPAENVVLRIDPIFPTDKGLVKLDNVLQLYSQTLLLKNVSRIRVSIVDEYKHVKQRYKDRGWPEIYPGKIYPSKEQIKKVIDLLEYYGYRYETCAEPELVNQAHIDSFIYEVGCISRKDLEIMNLECTDDMYENPQKRHGCHCLNIKTELLENRHPCKHGCVYCYWK